MQNINNPERPQITLWRMRIACWQRNAMDTNIIFNIYSYSTTTRIARRTLNDMLHVYCLSLFCVMLLGTPVAERSLLIGVLLVVYV